MKIKNLTGSPMQLGDGRMIGASGFDDERKYGLKELTGRDQQRVERGILEVIQILPADAGNTKEVEKNGAKLNSNGGKSNVK